MRVRCFTESLGFACRAIEFVAFLAGTDALDTDPAFRLEHVPSVRPFGATAVPVASTIRLGIFCHFKYSLKLNRFQTLQYFSIASSPNDRHSGSPSC